ncbi:hypothetical protein NPIL_65031 [Nephila pilipes]|uniref:Uncharacterized protein n=1 Tax=Nephila pilipes TaxID=299642 RepID=A0A8X6QBI9_NEPPI|nr:hypothetical protein NPIL_65031 [Nephila pilipes]
MRLPICLSSFPVASRISDISGDISINCKSPPSLHNSRGSSTQHSSRVEPFFRKSLSIWALFSFRIPRRHIQAFVSYSKSYPRSLKFFYGERDSLSNMYLLVLIMESEFSKSFSFSRFLL